MPNPFPFRAWSPTFGQAEPEATQILAYNAQQAAQLWQEHWDNTTENSKVLRGEPTQVFVIAPDSTEIQKFAVIAEADVKYVAARRG